jgi:hypothetical protein
MKLVSLLQLPVGIGDTLASVACSTSANPLQLLVIVALITTSGIFFTVTGITAMSMATTLVGLISAGTGITDILATLASFTGATEMAGASTAIAIGLINAISQILGCS